MYSNIRTIKVGTFNLMNFMLPNRPAYNGQLCYNNEEYRHKSEWVEFMLNEIDADIIGFQELFHREALVRIIKNNPRYRKARLYVAEETGEQPSVALLSRYPVENLEVFTHFPEEAVIDFYPKGRDHVSLPFTTFTRPVIKADVRIPNYGLITIFVIHLKSKREIFYQGECAENPVDLARAQSRSLMLRASESVAVRALVANALEIPDRPVILCGDVNDTGNAVTSRIISGEVPQHRLSDSVKHRVWDLLLYHVKDIQARRSYQDFYYTHIHNGMYESLDHIMVSQELVTEYPRNTGRVGLVSVYNDHLVDQTFTTHGVDKCKSDHGVVVCSIELDLDRAAKYMRDNVEYPDETDNRKDEIDNRKKVVESRNEMPAKPIVNEDEDSEPAPVPMFNMQNSLERWKSSHSTKDGHISDRRNPGDKRFGRNALDGRKNRISKCAQECRADDFVESIKSQNNIQTESKVIEFKEKLNKPKLSEHAEIPMNQMIELAHDFVHSEAMTEDVKQNENAPLERSEAQKANLSDVFTEPLVSSVFESDVPWGLEDKNADLSNAQQMDEKLCDMPAEPSVTSVSETMPLSEDKTVDSSKFAGPSDENRNRSRRRTTTRRPMGLASDAQTQNMDEKSSKCDISAEKLAETPSPAPICMECEVEKGESVTERDSSTNITSKNMAVEKSEDVLECAEKVEKSRRRTKRTEKNVDSEGARLISEQKSEVKTSASKGRKTEKPRLEESKNAETVVSAVSKPEPVEVSAVPISEKDANVVDKPAEPEPPVKVRRLFRPVPVKTVKKD